MTPAQFRKLGEAWGGEEWQRPLARALVNAGLLHGDHADVTVRRYATGKREPPAEITDWIVANTKSFGAWLVGRTDAGKKGIIHLRAPRFFALIERQEIVHIEWLDEKPSPRVEGKILAEALAYM